MSTRVLPSGGPAGRRGVALALAIAALVVVAGTLAQLLNGTERVSGSNDVAPQQFAVVAPARTGFCQSSETLYAGTNAVRMTVASFGRPTGPLDVSVSADGRTLARGALDAGWKEGVIDVPLDRVPERSTRPVTWCARSSAPGRLAFGGEPADSRIAAVAGRRATEGRVSLIGLRAGHPTLLGSAGEIVRHYERGTAEWLGAWTWFLMIALLVGAFFAAGGALLSHRRAHRLVVVAALALGSCWALLTPPFMVPDEVAHVAYVQGLVETGELPIDRAESYDHSPREGDLLAGLHFFDVIGDETSKPPWTRAEEAEVRAAESSQRSRRTLDAGTASANPPLYYLAQAPVYAATRGLGLLNQQLPMRMLSVLLGGLTAWLVFGFLREGLPRLPLAAPVGALAVVLQPVFGFITAGVNADAALFAASAGTLWALTVLLRRGLTRRRAVLLGVALAAGMLTKPLFLGLVPAGLAALALAYVRTPGPRRGRLVDVAGGLAVALVPVFAYSLLGNALSDHPYFPGGVPVASPDPDGAAPVPLGFTGQLSYMAQVFLPRVPFLADHIPGFPLRDVWFEGFVGRFGWLDYGFARSITDVAVAVAAVVFALAAAALVRVRAVLPANWPLLVCLGIALAGVAGAIAQQQYRAELIGAPAFTQARYLLPLLGLYGGLVALAAHGLGRRLAAPVGIALLTLAALHEVAAMVLTVERYYA